MCLFWLPKTILSHPRPELLSLPTCTVTSPWHVVSGPPDTRVRTPLSTNKQARAGGGERIIVAKVSFVANDTLSRAGSNRFSLLKLWKITVRKSDELAFSGIRFALVHSIARGGLSPSLSFPPRHRHKQTKCLQFNFGNQIHFHHRQCQGQMLERYINILTQSRAGLPHLNLAPRHPAN